MCLLGGLGQESQTAGASSRRAVAQKGPPIKKLPTSASVGLSSVPVTDSDSEGVNVSFSDFGAGVGVASGRLLRLGPQSPSARVARLRPDSCPWNVWGTGQKSLFPKRGRVAQFRTRNQRISRNSHDRRLRARRSAPAMPTPTSFSFAFAAYLTCPSFPFLPWA